MMMKMVSRPLNLSRAIDSIRHPVGQVVEIEPLVGDQQRLHVVPAVRFDRIAKRCFEYFDLGCKLGRGLEHGGGLAGGAGGQ